MAEDVTWKTDAGQSELSAKFSNQGLEEGSTDAADLVDGKLPACIQDEENKWRLIKWCRARSFLHAGPVRINARPIVAGSRRCPANKTPTNIK